MDINGANTALSLLSTGVSAGTDPTSLLTQFYSAQLSTSLAASRSTAAVGAPATTPQDTVSVPPWDPSKDTRSTDGKLADALSTTKFITTTGNYFDTSSVPDDQKQLFTAYLALSKLDSIATDAAATGTVSGELSGLDKKFQAGLSQLTDYLKGVTFTQMTLVEGKKLPTATAKIIVPRDITSSYAGPVVVNGAATDPIPGLTGSETFNITVKKAGGTTVVPIDLSQMGATPLTLANVADFINTQLAANNVVTRVARNEISTTQFGLKINGVETESVSFSATTGTPALYVAGTSGSGTDQAGQLVRFDDTGADPAFDFASRIEATSGSTTTPITSPSTSTTTTTSVTTPTLAPLAANGTAVDSEGHVYVVGTTQGTVNGEAIQGTQDAVLTKYDSTGQVLWTRLLGAASSAQGYSVATDASGNVVVAGQVDAPLTQGAVGGGKDAFVTKYNSEGEEQWTRQVDPVGDDGATSLAIAADGSIYVGGYAKGALTNTTTYQGAGDATVTKLTSSGARVYAREFGTTASDQTRGVAVASDGNLLVASVENDHAILRKFDSTTGAGAEMWSVDLGALQGGNIGGITVDGGSVYVAGTTSNAALDAGGSAAILNAAQGGTDGFVTRIDDSGASAAANYTTYIGTAAADTIKGIAASAGQIYVTGNTQGTLPGQTQIGAVNGFVAQLDTAGNLVGTAQYGGRNGVASGNAIAVAPQGASGLDALGLPNGSVDYAGSQLLTANSTLRAGDTFSISVNGKPARSVSIAADETLLSLKNKINGVLLQSGKASTTFTTAGYKLQITASPGTSITFTAGKTGFDALAGLGLPAGSIVNDLPTDSSAAPTQDTTIKPADLTPKNNFVALGIDPGITLQSQDAAKTAQTQIEGAMRAIRLAYTTLTQGKFVAGTASSGASSVSSGPAPAYIQAQIANYQAGLAWLQNNSAAQSTGLALLSA